MDPNAKSKCCGVKITEPHKPNCPVLTADKEVLGEVEKDETMHHILKLQIAIAEVLIRTKLPNSSIVETAVLRGRLDSAKKFLDKD